jgi:hypothetical protein
MAPPPPPPFGLGLGLVHPFASLAPPPPLAGYSLWLDATYGGNTSSSWVDQSAGAHTATPAGAGAAAVLVPGAVNGRAAYQFTSGGAYLATPSYAGSTSVTAIAAFQAIATTSSRGGVIDADESNNYAMIYGTAEGSEWFGSATHVFALSSVVYGSVSIQAGVYDPTNSFSGNGVVGWYNNASFGVPLPATARSAVATVRTIGRWTLVAQTINAYLCEIVEWPFTLTIPQLTNEYNRLAAKWI